SVAVVLVPEGHVLRRPPVPTRLDYEDTRAGVARSCRLLHEARARMSSVIKDPDLRNSAVISLTPVDLATRFLKGNAKPMVEAVVTNYCDIPISGSVTIEMPNGWQSNKKSWTFSNLQSGKSFRASFNLNPGKSSSTLPDEIKVWANVKVVSGGLSADYVIKAIAKASSFESAIMNEPGSQPQTNITPVYSRSGPRDVVGR
ncbi:MAG: NEW3 domain-containing protein, partial [Armatimonadota bacterium]